MGHPLLLLSYTPETNLQLHVARYPSAAKSDAPAASIVNADRRIYFHGVGTNTKMTGRRGDRNKLPRRQILLESSLKRDVFSLLDIK